MIIELISFFAGIIVAIVIAKHYYVRAARELKNEASELRRLNNLMLRGMEDAGLVEFNKDEKGNIKGLNLKIAGTVEAKSGVKGKVTVETKGKCDK